MDKNDTKQADKSNNPEKLRTITLEEHFATQAFMDGPGQQIRDQAKMAHDHPQVGEAMARLMNQLLDIGDGRIADMDSAGIDVQVLSLTSPGVEQVEKEQAISIASNANELLSKAVENHPDRFVGLAALPTIAPDLAAEELERMVRDHGFKGAVINGHINGRYLDDEYFWPILESAESLNVPIYLHPTPPPQTVIATSYSGNYSREIAALLATGAWGWHIETAIHMLRIILSGAFDQYPKLQFIIGHLGEALPFMMERINLGLPKEVTKLDHTVGDYLRQNIHYTFSGFNYTQSFLDLLLHVGPERIMFSTDYPYSSMEVGSAFLNQLPVSPANKNLIAHKNAENLLKL